MVIVAVQQKETKIKALQLTEREFSDLENLARVDGKTKRLSSNEEKLMLVASYAVTSLYVLGKERLLVLEKEGHVHSSTISGGSLDSARFCIDQYMGGERMFTRDDYEQLGRSCRSVKTLLEKGILRY